MAAAAAAVVPGLREGDETRTPVLELLRNPSQTNARCSKHHESDNDSAGALRVYMKGSLLGASWCCYTYQGLRAGEKRDKGRSACSTLRPRLPGRTTPCAPGNTQHAGGVLDLG